MQNLTKLQWLAAFAAALRVCAVPEDAIAKVSEPMWEAAGLLDPEQAAAEYTGMLVSAGMRERRSAWRGWPPRSPNDPVPSDGGDFPFG